MLLRACSFVYASCESLRSTVNYGHPATRVEAQMINETRLVETFLDLVRIDSPSGEEAAIAEELEYRLGQLGLTTP